MFSMQYRHPVSNGFTALDTVVKLKANVDFASCCCFALYMKIISKVTIFFENLLSHKISGSYINYAAVTASIHKEMQTCGVLVSVHVFAPKPPPQ